MANIIDLYNSFWKKYDEEIAESIRQHKMFDEACRKIGKEMNEKMRWEIDRFIMRGD